jgi:hypothetical protein
VAYVKTRVDEQYEQGRNTNFGDEELERMVKEGDAELYEMITMLHHE